MVLGRGTIEVNSGKQKVNVVGVGIKQRTDDGLVTLNWMLSMDYGSVRRYSVEFGQVVNEIRSYPTNDSSMQVREGL